MAQIIGYSSTLGDADTYPVFFVNGGSLSDSGATPANRNDSSFEYCNVNNNSGTYRTFKFVVPENQSPGPLANAGITVYFAHAQADADTAPYAPSSGGSATVLRVELWSSTDNMVSGTQLGSSGDITANEGSFALASFAYNGAFFNNADYNTYWQNLYVRVFFVSGGGGSPNSRRSIALSYLTLEIPDPTPNGYAYAAQVDPYNLRIEHLPPQYKPSSIPEVVALSSYTFNLDGTQKSFTHEYPYADLRAVFYAFFSSAPYLQPSPNDDLTLYSSVSYSAATGFNLSSVGWSWSGFSGRTEVYITFCNLASGSAGSNTVSFIPANVGGTGTLVVFGIRRPGYTGAVPYHTYHTFSGSYAAATTFVSVTPTVFSASYTNVIQLIAGLNSTGAQYLAPSVGSNTQILYQEPFASSSNDTAFVAVGNQDTSLTIDSLSADWNFVRFSISYASVVSVVNGTASGSISPQIDITSLVNGAVLAGAGAAGTVPTIGIQDYVTGFSVGGASTSGSSNTLTLSSVLGYAEAYGGKLYPDAILYSVNLSGPVSSIQDDPTNPDPNWLTIN